jgi:pimeloyl-ACP methyl ester carboxylesterase
MRSTVRIYDRSPGMKVLFLLLEGLLVLFVASVAFTFVYSMWVERLYPPAGQFVEVEGVRLHYVDTSPTGEPLGTVVLLHGASSNLAESMFGIGRSLASSYRVIAFDRPGHGWSEREDGPRAAQPGRQAALIAQALREIGIRNAVIVGHSWSGSVVPHFALDHTDVAGAILILSGVTYPWPGGAVSWHSRLAASWAGWLLTRTIVVPLGLAIRPSALAHTFAPQETPPDFVEKAEIALAFRPRSFQANGEDLAALHEAVTRQSARYPEIRIPAIVIGGDADEIVWTDLHSRSFARDVPGAELIVLPDVGHMPQYARPDLILSKIETLAKRIAPATAAMP